MPKGGARVQSGPAPDPNALRRDRDASEWTSLPPEGRQGVPPRWPLGGRRSAREKTLWGYFWSLPQAVMWEKQTQVFEVALYVRRLVEVEQPDAPVNRATLVRQMADSLGLTTPGMRMNRWRIRGVEQKGQEATTERRSARDRLTVVVGG